MKEKLLILFESRPDFTGSSKLIYDELIKRGFDKKYDLVWAVDKNFNEKTNYKIVKYFNTNPKNRKEILKKTKCIIDSNRYIHKENINVFRIHVRHGNNLKRLPDYSWRIGDLDVLLSSSEFMKEIDKKIYPKEIVEKEKILGFPIYDELYKKIDLYKNGFIKSITNSDKIFNKIILWTPTYRQNKFSKKDSSSVIFPYGLPLLNNIEDIQKLNEILVKNNILLLYQIHHGQSDNFEKIKNFSNICNISNSICEKFNLSFLNLITAADGFISDYSSAYFEFLLMNKPIALAIPDLIEYNRAFGFWYNYLEIIKGEYLLDIKNLLDFIENISNNIDKTKELRENILNKVHNFKDNKSTERVINYLIQNNYL